VPTFWGRLATAVAATTVLAIAQRAEAQSVPKNELFADFLFIVDESGSMRSEHDWLDEMIYELETKLQTRGLGIGNHVNRYGLVGFGSFTPEPRAFDMDPSTPGLQQFGNASQFAQTSLSLITNGGIEDDYDGIDFGLNTYDFRPGAAVNLVLVTDDYRDVVDGNLSFASILGNLHQHNALLNVVVNHAFYDTEGNGAVGADGWGNAFVPDGDGFRTGVYRETTDPSPSPVISPNPALPWLRTEIGVFDSDTVPLSSLPDKGIDLTSPMPRPMPPDVGVFLPPPIINPPIHLPTRPPYNEFYSKIQEHYVELAWASEVKTARGAAWDLNMLRPGGGTVKAFTDAFTTIKAEEAYRQSVPEPGSLLGLTLLGLGSLWAKRRMDLDATAENPGSCA
jgi:hypothetical protein